MQRTITTVMLSLLPSIALAQGAPPPAEGGDPIAAAQSFIKGLDKDGDGKLNRAETKGYPLEADFDKIDANHDGLLDAKELAEFKAHMARPGGGSPPPPPQSPPPAQK